jgi:hypothetical protein
MNLYLQRKREGQWRTVKTDVCRGDSQDADAAALYWLAEIYAGVIPAAWPGPYRVVGEPDSESDGFVTVVTHLDRRLVDAVSEVSDTEAERAAGVNFWFRYAR